MTNTGTRTSTSTETIRTFPRRRPVDDPPPLRGELVNGRRTPLYALAWFCPDRSFFKNLGGGEEGKVDTFNFQDEVSAKWRTCPKPDRPGLKPMPYPDLWGNFYLIAMFNERDADHLKRVSDLAGDPLIQSARVCLGVYQDPTLEETLHWFRF
ncbi:hypothetical protein B0H11DRAFT_1981483 [Mycena galericulata]|nr:hypothetical protein B0H11DRAFT_1981483 [Mycena galericulata]